MIRSSEWIVARVLAIGIAFTGQLSAADQTPTKDDFIQDFDYASREIGSTYAYFDAKATSWSDVPRLYRADLQRVTTRDEFVGLLERVLDELYDPHAQLNVNTATSPRLVPSGSDLWAEWRGTLAIVTQVRPDSDAQRAGIKPGAIIVAINSVTIEDAVESRLGRTYPHSTPAARDWALRAVLAGHHNAPRVLQVREGGTKRTVELPARDQYGTAAPTLVSHSVIRPGIGYIRLNDSLGNEATVEAFDRALGDLRETRALIVDSAGHAQRGQQPRRQRNPRQIRRPGDALPEARLTLGRARGGSPAQLARARIAAGSVRIPGAGRGPRRSLDREHG